MRKLAVWLLAIGIPTLLGLWLISDEETRERGLIGFSFLSWITLGLIGYFIPVFLSYYRVSFRHKVHCAFYAYFAIVGFCTVVAFILGYAPAPREQLISLAQLVIWSTTFVTIYFLVKSISEYRRAMHLIDIAGFAIGLSVLAAYVSSIYFGYRFGEFINPDNEGLVRAFGPFGDQVGFALGYFALRTIVQGRLALMVFYGVAILLTGTVGAYISFIVGILWLLFRGTRLANVRLRLRRRFLVLTCVSVIAMAGFLFTQMGETAKSRIQTSMQGAGSVQQRLTSMSLGMRVFVDNPLGVGYLGFNSIGKKYGFAAAFGDTKTNATYTTNNQILQAAVDGGVPAVCALVVFLCLLYRVIRAAAHRAEEAISADLIAGLAWLFGLAIGNQSAVWLLPTSITSLVFFLVFGVLLRVAGWSLTAAHQMPKG